MVHFNHDSSLVPSNDSSGASKRRVSRRPLGEKDLNKISGESTPLRVSFSPALDPPLFSDYPFDSIPTLFDLDPTRPPTPLPPVSPPSESDPLHEGALEDEEHDAMVFYHPNSPYRPWESVERWQGHRASSRASDVSFLSGYYSRPLSRSGAMAPEPSEVLEGGWRGIGRKLKGKVKKVKGKLSQLKKPYDTVRSLLSSTALLKHGKGGGDRGGIRPVSVESWRSLKAWIAARGRMSLGEGEEEGMMSVEEYELNGSWISDRS